MQCGFPGGRTPVWSKAGAQRDRKELRTGHGPSPWPSCTESRRAAGDSPVSTRQQHNRNMSRSRGNRSLSLTRRTEFPEDTGILRGFITSRTPEETGSTSWRLSVLRGPQASWPDTTVFTLPGGSREGSVWGDWTRVSSQAEWSLSTGIE